MDDLDLRIEWELDDDGFPKMVLLFKMPSDIQPEDEERFLQFIKNEMATQLKNKYGTIEKFYESMFERCNNG